MMTGLLLRSRAGLAGTLVAVLFSWLVAALGGFFLRGLVLAGVALFCIGITVVTIRGEHAARGIVGRCRRRSGGCAVAITATLARSSPTGAAELAFERFTEELLPLGFLLGSEQAQQFFGRGLTSGLKLFHRLDSITFFTALEQGSHLLAGSRLDLLDALLLFVVQSNGGRYFGRGQSLCALQLQRDLTEALLLLFVENRCDQLLVLLARFGQPFQTFLAAQIAELAVRLALLAELLIELL